MTAIIAAVFAYFFSIILGPLAHFLIPNHECKSPILAHCHICDHVFSRYYALIPFSFFNAYQHHHKNSCFLAHDIINCIAFISFFILFYSQTNPLLLLAYTIFFVALMSTMHTDFCTLLISRFLTLFLIPVPVILSYFNVLPISLFESIIGACSAYALLWLIAKLYRLRTGIDGMGEGDAELLALIGAFLGIAGWWYSLLIGSLIGSMYGILFALFYNSSIKNIRLPFGPFLAFGAIVYTLLHSVRFLLI